MGHGGGLHPVRHPELAQDVRHVDARRLARDEQRVGDLLVRPAGGHEWDDLAFSIGETDRVGRGRGLGRRPHPGRCERGAPAARSPVEGAPRRVAPPSRSPLVARSRPPGDPHRPRGSPQRLGTSRTLQVRAAQARPTLPRFVGARLGPGGHRCGRARRDTAQRRPPADHRRARPGPRAGASRRSAGPPVRCRAGRLHPRAPSPRRPRRPRHAARATRARPAPGGAVQPPRGSPAPRRRRPARRASLPCHAASSVTAASAASRYVVSRPAAASISRASRRRSSAASKRP